KCDVLRPKFRGKRVQTLHSRSPAAISQETQRPRDDDWIVDSSLIHIGLTDENNRCSRLLSEQTLHGRQGRRLMTKNHLALLVSGREHLQDAEQATRHDAHFYKYASVLFVLAPNKVKRSNRGHHKRAGNGGATHVVRILPSSPGIQNQLPKTTQLNLPIRGALVTDWVLHPGIGCDNEIAGQP